MNHITFTIGQGYDSHNRPIADLADKRERALTDIAREFGGYTAQGGWIDNTGHLVTEPSLAVDVMTDASETAIQAEAQSLARTFDQSAVMVSESPASVSFVEQSAVKAA